MDQIAPKFHLPLGNTQTPHLQKSNDVNISNLNA